MEDLAETAKAALRQIDEKRYGADFDQTKRLVKIGIAFFGKNCCVACERAIKNSYHCINQNEKRQK